MRFCEVLLGLVTCCNLGAGLPLAVTPSPLHFTPDAGSGRPVPSIVVVSPGGEAGSFLLILFVLILNRQVIPPRQEFRFVCHRLCSAAAHLDWPGKLVVESAKLTPELIPFFV